MATAQDIINEWAADDDEKQRLVKIRSGLPLRWLSQGQIRYSEKSLLLRSVWNPTVPSTGLIALPPDFLYEFPDRVKRNVNATTDIFLKKIDYYLAYARYFSGLLFYSIYGGNFYVWAPQAATPSVPYVRKAAVLTTAAVDLEIPTEYQANLIPYLEMKYLRLAKEISIADFLAMQKNFDMQAADDGIAFRRHMDSQPTMRGSFF